MTYTPDKPRLAESSDQLRVRIPGWGADLDPADRPSVPRERFDPSLTGAHWRRPEPQPERWPRERSVEHTERPAVFGTSCPPKGLSGLVRKHAYARYSEAQAAHWLLLMLGDRIDTVESAARSLVSARPDNPITQTGVLSERRRHGWSSRVGRGRADLKHQWMDPILVGAPWALAATGVYKLVSGAARRARS